MRGTSRSLTVSISKATGKSGTTQTIEVQKGDGGEGTILVTLDSDNYDDYKLTIPVAAKAKTTEVKLEMPTNVETSVQGVQVSGLDALTNRLDGTSVKVELDVKPENAPSDETVKNKIQSWE